MDDQTTRRGRKVSRRYDGHASRERVRPAANRPQRHGGTYDAVWFRQTAEGGRQMSTNKGSAHNGLIRQGDLLLVPVDALPERTWNGSNGRRIVLAEGEATGHAHVIDDVRAELRDE